MNVIYKKASIEDIDFLTESRVEVLKAANRLEDDVDMAEVEAQSHDYYRKALSDGSHTAYLVFDGNRFIGGKRMIRMAKNSDLEIVLQITRDTISEIYFHYYAKGVVQFFLEHHSRENVLSDIENGIVWLLEEEGCMVGTVTVKENAVNRLFVLPRYQSHGYGSQLMDFAEAKIAEKFSHVHIDSSLAAKEMYLKRGYQEKKTCRIEASNGDVLIYDEMEKKVHSQWNGINYNGRIFVPQSNTENGEVDGQTIFRYFQENDLFWAEYSGGDVLKGHMVGTVAENGELHFQYQHLNKDRRVRIGKCHSIPYILENGKIALQEKWQWLNGDLSSGESVVVEK